MQAIAAMAPRGVKLLIPAPNLNARDNDGHWRSITLRDSMLIRTILPTMKPCIFPAYVKVRKNLPTSSEKSALHSQRRHAR